MADIVDLSDLIRTGRAGEATGSGAPAPGARQADEQQSDAQQSVHQQTDPRQTGQQQAGALPSEPDRAGPDHPADPAHAPAADSDSELIRFDAPAPPAPDTEPGFAAAEELGRFLHGYDAPEAGAPGTGPGAPPDPALDWTNQELADLYRVQRLLAQAGIAIGTDRGVSDEGDPWFVFLDGQGDVFVHLCRIDGLYLLDSAVQGGIVRGPCFRSLIDAFAGRADTARAAGRPEGATVLNLQRRGKIVTHPGAALAALIWTLYLANDDLALLQDAGTPDTGLPETGTPRAGLSAAALQEAGQEPGQDSGPEADASAGAARAAGPGAGHTPGLDSGAVDIDVAGPAVPAPEFAELFAAPQDAAEFLSEAKAARDASLRAVVDGRDSLHSPFAALAHPLGATALGLSALAVAYGVTWAVPETDLAALDPGLVPALPETDGDDAATPQADRHDAEADHGTKLATAAPIFADDPARKDLAPEETADLAARSGDAAATQAQSATALAAPAADGAPVTAATQPDASGDVAPSMGTARAAPGEAGSATRPDGTQLAQGQAGPPQGGEAGAEAGRDAAAIPGVLSSIGLPDLLDGDFNVFTFDTPSGDAAQGLFDIIDEMIVVAAAPVSGLPEAGPAERPVVAATGPEESVLVQSMAETVDVAAPPKFSLYSEEVRVFIDYLVTTSQVEVITYRNEVLLIDRRALDEAEGEAFARSWSYEDGGIISTVGIRSDFEAFDLTV